MGNPAKMPEDGVSFSNRNLPNAENVGGDWQTLEQITDLFVPHGRKLCRSKYAG